ncbi:hypothetical protein ARMGADRAFT_611115 [Armillaria gallica]|uniref:Uncharacterized protein n=1 Tax=Armillaria gallica TaxID=47427 RepID=A0A2H3CY72_ARMGA|nr:hypothetical protein ARMGADRAFT_611115 [Armillaria gallica]
MSHGKNMSVSYLEVCPHLPYPPNHRLLIIIRIRPTTHDTSPIILACVIFASHGEDDPPIVEGSHLTTIITKSRYRSDLSFSDIPSRQLAVSYQGLKLRVLHSGRSPQFSSHTRENVCFTRLVSAKVRCVPYAHC